MKKLFKIFVIFSVVLSPLCAQQGDSLTINYNYINSLPQNADVFLNEKHIGSTPLFFKWQDSVFPKQVKVKMKGFADYTETLYENGKYSKTIPLISLKGSGKVNLVKEDKATYFNKPRKWIPIVFSSLITAGGGAFAYYFKSLAIDNRKIYDETGDLTALDKKKKYDIISGVSLALCQAGLASLLYFLFIDN